MRAGLHIVSFNQPPEPEAIARTLADAARAAEDAGLEHLSLMDHWFQMDQYAPATDPMLEGYTALGYVAALTERIPIGLLVTGVTYRHPGLLAKQVATLGVLSGGRAYLGIGAAWYEREHLGLGVTFPAVSERFERLEEAIQICKQMWSGDQSGFQGKHYTLAETICEPRPATPPRILIGGSGERKTLKLVARYADACNFFASSPDEVKHKLDVLAKHCEAEGRDYGAIEKTVLWFGNPLADADATVEGLKTYASLGVDMAIFMPMGVDPVPYTRGLGTDIVPRMADLDVRV